MTIERFELDTEQWAVVPRVPTQEIVRAGADSLDTFLDATVIECYEAMIAAAPRPEAGLQSDRMRARFDEIELEICEGKHTASSVFTQMRTAALCMQHQAPRPVPTSERIVIDPDALANYIRLVDGCHVMGAGELAKKIAAWVSENAILRPAEPDGGAV